MLLKFLKQIDSLLLGSVFQLHWANRILQSKLDKCNSEQFKSDKRLKLSAESLNHELTSSIERVERIENKAMSTLLGVTVAIAVLSVASGVIGPDGVFSCQLKTLRLIATTLIVVAIGYLFGSGFLALQAYKIGKIYLPTLFDLSPLSEPAEQSTVFLYCIEQNRLVSIMRSNRLSASFSFLRNGLATVLILSIFIIIIA
jgi:hypothetical protein